MDRYLAFISYRHQERDMAVSALMRKGLENHRLPADAGIPKNRRVFRDTDELPTSSNLGEDIEEALKDSGFLIAVCSEDYVRSKWCMRELESYLAMGRKDRILPVLVSGEESAAVPDIIRDVPIAADLRGSGKRDLKRAVGEAVPSLLSRMSGIDRAKIAAAEMNRRFALAGGILGAVTAGVLAFSLFAVYTAGEIAKNNDAISEATVLAREEQQQALAERNNALVKKSDYYAGQAWKAISGGDDETAVRMALEALPDDLHGGEPVSESALNALRLVLNLPSAPEDAYQLIHSTPTGFTATGVFLQTSGQAILSGETYGVTERYVDFETGLMNTITSSARAEAAENGYSFGYIVQNGYDNQIWYGPEKPMYNNGGDEASYTLNGEPFFADHILQNRNGSYLFAWLEDPLPGQTGRAAVFLLNHRSGDPNSTQSEAVTEIPVTGRIRCAAFSNSSSFLSVIDDGGRLRLYDAATGECRGTAEGRWSFICYPNTSDAVLAVSEDGAACIFDTVSMEKVLEFASPSPVKKLWYCRIKDAVLACCEDGFRIYDMTSGKLMYEKRTGDEPVEAIWGGYDNYLFSHSGNDILVLFGDRVDLYGVNAVSDQEVTDATVLYSEGIVDDYRNAFYSPDGRSVYTESVLGDICKWDIADGRLLWKNEAGWEVQPNVHEYACLSADGRSVWRAISYMNGVEKIDADTGETVYISELVSASGSVTSPVESPGGDTAFVKGEYGSGELVLFDTGTGEAVWRTDHPGEAVFTEDGSEIHCLRSVFNTKEYTQDYVFRRIDVRTGELLEEKVILSLDQALYDETMTADEGSRLAVIISEDSEDPGENRIWAADLSSGSIVSYVFPKEGPLYARFPYDGGACVKWMEGENDFICRLNGDGTFGEAFPADSAEGRRLDTSPAQYVILNGEEMARTVGSFSKSFTLTRLSDGAVMMDLSMENYFNGIVSPDGETFCVYGSYLNPTVITMSDEDTLVRKAKKWLEGHGDDKED